MIFNTEVTKITTESSYVFEDAIAVEEPLEIRLRYGKGVHRKEKSISVTMRTPSDDKELTMGFLYSEGIIKNFSDVLSIKHCAGISKPEEEGNVILAELRDTLDLDLDKLDRHFYTTSSCGVCGKSSIEAITVQDCPILPKDAPLVASSIIHKLPILLLKKQDTFLDTGGLHAAALFDKNGTLLLTKEDIGRHNAVDKLIGAAYYQRLFPLTDKILLVSGRAGFELVQKAIKAGIPIMAAVGAPSSLAVNLARTFDFTLLGFVREKRFNIYSGKDRVLINKV